MNNREVKFKVWDRSNKKMFDVENMHVSPTISCFITRSDGTSYILVDGENADFCEFAGLKDKNGKELYEGDIVLFGDSKKNYLIEYLAGKFFGIWQSKWNPGENEALIGESGRCDWFKWEYFEGGEFGNTMRRTSNFSIIGNKFENPELLVDGQFE